MIATKDSIEPHSSDQLPASTRVYVQGELLPRRAGADARDRAVADKDDERSDRRANAPVRVYDCSGPWGDPQFAGTSDEGSPKHAGEMDRRIAGTSKPTTGVRGEAAGQRVVFSGKHAEYASKAERNRLVEFPG